MAAELGLTVPVLRERLAASPEASQRLALGSTGVVPRQTFLREFSDIAGLLGLQSAEAERRQREAITLRLRAQGGTDDLISKAIELGSKANQDGDEAFAKVKELDAKLRQLNRTIDGAEQQNGQAAPAQGPFQRQQALLGKSGHATGGSVRNARSKGAD